MKILYRNFHPRIQIQTTSPIPHRNSKRFETFPISVKAPIKMRQMHPGPNIPKTMRCPGKKNTGKTSIQAAVTTCGEVSLTGGDKIPLYGQNIYPWAHKNDEV
ncbi:hypothetical protein TNCV_2198841 [Trichonephila clavipes]|nr:hypothetical protein TNCV_2198841 [Trichonephila clavipes]